MKGCDKLNLKQLDYFVKTSQYKSINEAAAALYISQPSLSYALNTLEKELNVQLFVRNKTGIYLTPSGRRILNDSIQILNTISEWSSLSKFDEATQQITLIGENLIGDKLIPDIILSYINIYGSVSFQTHSHSIENQLSAPAQNATTILFCMCSAQEFELYRSLAIRHEWLYETMKTDNNVVLVNQENPLAQKPSLTLQDLVSAYTLVTIKPSGIQKSHQIFLNYFDQNKILYVPSQNAELKLVASSAQMIAFRSFLAKNYLNYSKNNNIVPLELADSPFSDSLIAFYPSSGNQDRKSVV